MEKANSRRETRTQRDYPDLLQYFLEMEIACRTQVGPDETNGSIYTSGNYVSDDGSEAFAAFETYESQDGSPLFILTVTETDERNFIDMYADAQARDTLPFIVDRAEATKASMGDISPVIVGTREYDTIAEACVDNMNQAVFGTEALYRYQIQQGIDGGWSVQRRLEYSSYLLVGDYEDNCLGKFVWDSQEVEMSEPAKEKLRRTAEEIHAIGDEDIRRINKAFEALLVV